MTAAATGNPRALGSHPFFRGLEGKLVPEVAPSTIECVYDAGTRLLKEGDPSDRFILIVEGKVALEMVLPDRPVVRIQTLGPGEVFGWSWLLPHQVWRLDARAVKRTQTLEIPSATLRSSLESHPEEGYRFLMRLLPIVAERLENTRIQLLDLHGR
jgi:CRP/FNR family transcriptional regulator, cyclic AMP receptor protein